MNKLKVISLFSGYGTQELALDYIGVDYENVANCDILKIANIAYDSLHKTTLGNLGDISKVNENDYPQCDLMTYSFPCFTKNTLVLTDEGFKYINDIQVGEYVVTHKNQLKKVTNFFEQGKKEIWEVITSTVDSIETTENHKFFVKTKDKKNGLFSEPYWKEVKDLDKNDYLGVPINKNQNIPQWTGVEMIWSDGRKTRVKNELSQFMDNNDFWWVIGRYIGDGWIRKQGGIIICCSSKDDTELTEITEKLNNLKFNYNVTTEGSVYKIHLPKKEMSHFVKQFGVYAHGKKLTKTIFDLPKNLLESFIEGYYSADGSTFVDGERKRICSVSRELIYGIGQCILKVYETPYSIYRTKKEKKYIIEGREVNQRDVYTIAYDLKDITKQSFIEDSYLWAPIRSVENTRNFYEVYDIEVEDDHSFTANGCIVHNCQDISISGVQKGIQKGTRSGLLFEVERILTKNQPKYLLMENVKNLVSNNHIENFKDHINFLNGVGYGCAWRVFNGADFGCPQNRERVFMISVYGMTNEEVNLKMLNVDKHKKDRIPMRPFIENDITEDLFIECDITPNEPKKDSVCKLIARRNDVNYDQARRIYSIDGCSPCLTTTGSPQIMVNGRIRTITGREAYRFMGVKEEDIDKLLSTTLTTKNHVALAGNSICVPVMSAIFTEFLSEYIVEKKKHFEQLKLF
jgi:site-specific DNA-cytosine methylase/intein/homing endonuclease